MIPAFKAGMVHTVSLTQHHNELVRRNVNAMKANSNRISRQIFRLISHQLAEGGDKTVVAHGAILVDLAKRYGCKHELISMAVGNAIKLLKESEAL
jgi:hypothetical protein